MTEVVGIADLNQMTVVKRWQIVDMPRKYSIAEHSYRVAMIAAQIAEFMGFDVEFQQRCIGIGLIHDIEEIFTGDTPTPIKKFLKNNDAYQATVADKVYDTFHGTTPTDCVSEKHVVKLADYADTLFELFEARSLSYNVHSIEAKVIYALDEYIEHLDLEGPEGFREKMYFKEIPFDHAELDVKSFMFRMISKSVTRIF